MSVFTSIVSDVAERLRAREIREVVYFHCDHFEPWDFSQRSSERAAEEVVELVDALQRVDFGRRLTLFYSNPWNTRLSPAGGLLRVCPDDRIGFVRRTSSEETSFGAPLRYLRANSEHEIQVHIHHENFTRTWGMRDGARAEYLRGEAGGRDGLRFEFAIGQWLDSARREFGYEPERWFFVHGLWALNGSDPEGCTIYDEIGRLMRWGCRGDFTFPAGRPHCDPRFEAPYFCAPAVGPKSYDSPAAEPEFAWGNEAAATHKFFVWNSPIKATAASLDWGSASVRKRFGEPGALAREIVSESFSWDGVLFIKTHAHSMHRANRDSNGRHVPPHCYSPIRDLYGALFEGVAAAGARVTLATAGEVYDRFSRAPGPPITPKMSSFRHGVASSDLPQVGAMSEQVLSAIAQLGALAGPLVEGNPEKVTTEDVAETAHSGPPLTILPVLSRKDVRAAQIVHSRFGTKLAVDHIGIGSARLTLLLASLGISVRGIESSRSRYEAGLALASEVRRNPPHGMAFVDLVHGRFPECVAGDDLSLTIAIVTGLRHAGDARQRQPAMLALRRYGVVLLELDHLAHEHGDREARRAFVEELRQLGFGTMYDAEISRKFAFVLIVNNSALLEGSHAAGQIVSMQTAEAIDPRRTFSDTLAALSTLAPAQGHSALVELTEFVPDRGYCFCVRLPPYFPSGESLDNRKNSSLVVYQDGLPLGPANSQHRQIQEKGQGRYSHWKHALYFSTRDNSDPRLNGSRIHVFHPLTNDDRAPAILTLV